MTPSHLWTTDECNLTIGLIISKLQQHKFSWMRNETRWIHSWLNETIVWNMNLHDVSRWIGFHQWNIIHEFQCMNGWTFIINLNGWNFIIFLDDTNFIQIYHLQWITFSCYPTIESALVNIKCWTLLLVTIKQWFWSPLNKW
jgi:hypothetical protein